MKPCPRCQSSPRQVKNRLLTEQATLSMFVMRQLLFVDRATCCITAWGGVEQATEAVVQASHYYSDQFPGYSSVT